MTVTGGASPVGPSHPVSAEPPNQQQPGKEPDLEPSSAAQAALPQQPEADLPQQDAEASLPPTPRSTSGDRVRARGLFAELAECEKLIYFCGDDDVSKAVGATAEKLMGLMRRSKVGTQLYVASVDKLLANPPAKPRPGLRLIDGGASEQAAL